MIGGKNYKIALIIDNPKDAGLIAGMEGYGHVNESYSGSFPLQMTIQKPRTYFTAIMRSLKYSKMGIFNCIIKSVD